MFSEETMITMADGSKKNINLLKRGQLILNKNNKMIKVLEVVSYPNRPVVGIQLDNETGVFFTCPNTTVYCSYQNNNRTTADYIPFHQVNDKNAILKKSLKMFDPLSNVNIVTYDNTDINLVKTVYKLITIDNGTSYYANGILTNC
jgi:hypothetical protein